MKTVLISLTIVAAMILTEHSILAAGTDQSTTPTPTPTPKTTSTAVPHTTPTPTPILKTSVTPTAKTLATPAPTAKTASTGTPVAPRTAATPRLGGHLAPSAAPTRPTVTRPAATPIVIAPIQGKPIDVTPVTPTPSANSEGVSTNKISGVVGGLTTDPGHNSAKKITVTGLPREFHSGQVIEGKLLCPKFGNAQGASGVLEVPCVTLASAELKKHSFSPATALGPAGGKDCASYSRLAGLGPAFADTHVGGQCWACPALMDRNLTAPIDAANACTAGNDTHIVWQSAQYPEPGVAAFITPEIVQLAFADVGYVDAFLSKRVHGVDSNKQILWQQMIDSPNDSPEFKALIFNAILVAVASDLQDERTKNAVQIFEDYIKQRRGFIDRDAIGMYNAYGDLNSYKQNSAAGNTQMGAGPSGAMGIAPDDYLSAAYAAAVPDSRGESFMRALLDLSGTPYQKATSTAKESDGDKVALAAFSGYALDTVDKIHSLLQDLHVIKGIEAIEGKGFQGALLFLTFASSALEIAEGVMTMTEQGEAEKKYNELAAEINEDVSIATILKSGTDEEKNRLVMWWALATSSYGANDTVGKFPRKNADVCVTYPDQCGYIKRIVAKANSAVQFAPVHLAPAPAAFVEEVSATTDLAKLLATVNNSGTATAVNSTVSAAVQRVNQAVLAVKKFNAADTAAAYQHKSELDSASIQVRNQLTRIKGVSGAYPILQNALAPLPAALRGARATSD